MCPLSNNRQSVQLVAHLSTMHVHSQFLRVANCGHLPLCRALCSAVLEHCTVCCSGAVYSRVLLSVWHPTKDGRFECGGDPSLLLLPTSSSLNRDPMMAANFDRIARHKSFVRIIAITIRNDKKKTYIKHNMRHNKELIWDKRWKRRRMCYCFKYQKTNQERDGGVGS